MFPEWFRSLFFGFLSLLIVCGAIMLVIMVAAITKALYDEQKKKGRKQ